jgi:hypothetical protein
MARESDSSGVGSTTPRITPPVLPGPSSHVVADPNHDMHMAQDPNDDDDDEVNVDAFINTAYCDDIEEPALGPSEKRPTINKRLSFHSQKTPPDVVCTEPPRPGNIFTPNILHKCAGEQIVVPMKKKERKRKSKKDTMSQAAPIRAQDGPPRPKGLNHIVHTMGQPMLNAQMLQACSADMRSLHDAILYLETRQLGDNDSSYPLYMAKVPTGRDFVEDAPADIMLLRFADIFDVFHQNRLYQTLSAYFP